MGFQIIRVERLKTMGNVKSSALHTFREIPTENAISDKTAKNVIVGPKTADGVYQAVFERIAQLDKKDKQATRCLEFVVTASPEDFAEDGALSSRSVQMRYFQNSLDFLRKKHGRENVVCAAVHQDEKTPHMAVYVVPVVDREARQRKRSVNVKGGGRTTIIEDVPAQAELSAKAYYHCPAALAQLQDDFHAGVSRSFGLERGVSRIKGLRHKRPAEWYAEQQTGLNVAANRLATREEDITWNFDKLDQHWKMLEADKARLAPEKARLDAFVNDLAVQKRNLDSLGGALAADRRRLDLDRQRLDQEAVELAKRIAESYRLKDSLADQKAALDMEEQEGGVKVAMALELLKEREKGLDDREALLDGYKAALNADIAAFQADRVAYHRAWMEKFKVASEEDKKKVTRELITQVKPVSRGRSM